MYSCRYLDIYVYVWLFYGLREIYVSGSCVLVVCVGCLVTSCVMQNGACTNKISIFSGCTDWWKGVLLEQNSGLHSIRRLWTRRLSGRTSAEFAWLDRCHRKLGWKGLEPLLFTVLNNIFRVLAQIAEAWDQAIKETSLKRHPCCCVEVADELCACAFFSRVGDRQHRPICRWTHTQVVWGGVMSCTVFRSWAFAGVCLCCVAVG